MIERRASGNTTYPLKPQKPEMGVEIPVKTMLAVSVGALALGGYLLWKV